MNGHSSEKAAPAAVTNAADRGLAVFDVQHSYGRQAVLDGVDLAVGSGEVVCLLGASGSGKSTLLRVLAGLEPLQAGRIEFDGQVVATPGREPPPELRGFGFVFQDHVLFPHLTVADNVAFGLRALPAAERAGRVAARLGQVGLAEFASRFPHTLSGGQQQRVALARALAPEPKLMLLDEPFASVDATLRRRLRDDTRRALKTSGVPSIVVTHDAEEAMELADRIAIVRAGRIVQVDTPEGVWRAPKDRFVAELFSDTDAITGRGDGDAVLTAFGRVPLADRSADAGAPYAVIARPGSVSLTPDASAGTRVADVRFVGDRYLVVVAAGAERLRAVFAHKPEFSVGAPVAVVFEAAGVLVYRE